MTTLKDIAKKANVSVATVSRYLNHKISIRPETEQNILDAIKELNYVPNIVAQSLKINRTSNVAVVLPLVNSLYYSEMTSGISSVLTRHNFNLFIFEVDHMKKTEEAIMQTLQENMIAGAIFIGLSYDQRFYHSLHILQDANIPVVYMNRMMEYENIPLVHPNLTACGKLASEHLIRRGKKKLGLIHALPDSSPLLELHLRSFSEPIRKAGLPDAQVIFSAQGITPPESCLDEIEKSGCDGLFILNELMAAGISRSLHQRGIHIPEDIAVLGFGNSLAGEITTPTLSCIDLQNFNLGVKSAEIILAEIEGADFKPITILEPHIIKRQST